MKMPTLNPKLKTILLLTLLAGLTGLLLLVVFIAFEESLVTQVVLAALLLLLWPLGFWWRQRRSQTAALAAGTTTATASTDEQPAHSYDELLGGVGEVVEFLRHNKPSGTQGDAVYGLPWFLVAGPVGSGKSSLLLTGGQSFNALESQRRTELSAVRPTTGCDWRVSDDAVWVDTAGRYYTDGADRADRDEWLGLLDALKRQRKERPLDGLIVTFSLAQLVKTPPEELKQQAQVLRARLNDALKSCGYRFPIYLVFTQADAVKGFDAYFADLGEPERAQVWGVTFALEQADQAHKLFHTEFDYLLDALLNRRLLRLSTTQEPQARLGVFDFPLSLYQLRQPLGQFAQELFKPSTFSEQPLLRGIYFTSCPPVTPAGPDAQQIREAQVTPRSFFTRDLFAQVFLRDRDVAASFRSTQIRPNRVRKYAAATLAGAVLCGVWILGMLFSFWQNNSLVNEAREAAQNVAGHARKANENSPARSMTQTEWEHLNELHQILVRLDGYDASWLGGHRFGLYVGPQIKRRVREVYFDFVGQKLLHPALKKLAEQLARETPAAAQPASADAQEQYYYKLKAYLMVEAQERVEDVFLQTQLAPFWVEYEGAQEQRHLSYYAQQSLLSEPQDDSVPRPKADAVIVAEARQKLNNFDVKRQVYNEVIRVIDGKGEALRLREMLSGQTGTEYFENADALKVPYAFTKEAYYNEVKGNAWVAIVRAVKEGKKRIYVLPDRVSEYERVQPDEILGRYQRDYLAAWIAFLKGVRLRRFEGKRQGVETLEALSKENSALAGIFDSVKRQTTLSEPPSTNWLGRLKALFDGKVGAQKSEVEKSFATLAGFKLTDYQAKLASTKTALDLAAAGDKWSQIASEIERNDKYRTEREQARSLLSALDSGGNPGGKAMGEALRLPLDNLTAALGAGGKEDMLQAWAAVVTKARTLEDRYPFVAGQREVLPDELAKYLTGDLTNFFNQHLKDKKFDATPKPFIEGEFNPEFVTYLKQAFQLRDVLFSAGGKFSYNVTLKAPPGQAAQMTVDGTPINAEGTTGNAQPSWPPSGGNIGIKLTLRPLNSAASVSPNAVPVPADVRQIPGLDGSWAIFRLLEGRAPQASYQLSLGGAGLTIQVPQPNPFTLNFRALRAPTQITPQPLAAN